LVGNMGLLLCLKGLWALPVPHRVGSATVYTLFDSVGLRALGLSCWVHCSCTVSALGFVLAVSGYMAELVTAEALADS
jgi:hypothetical protein